MSEEKTMMAAKLLTEIADRTIVQLSTKIEALEQRNAAFEQLFHAVQTFRNEKLLGRATALRATKGYVELCNAWDACKEEILK